MALEQTGVQLEAKGLDAFVASMSKAENKARDFATQLLGAARAENTFDVAMQKVVNSALAAQDRLAAQARTAGILQSEITALSAKYGEASTQVERKKAALERLNSQMASTERQIGTYTAQIIEMAAKTEQATKDQAAQAAALDEQRRAYAAMAQSVDQLSQEYGDNSAQVKAQRASLEAMASSLDQAEKAARRTADGVDQFGRAIADNNSKVNKFHEITVGAFREIGAIGLDKAQEALSGIGRFFQDSIKLAGDFEGSMMRFASVTGSAMQQSGLDTDDFRKLFLKMGADTQYSALQASDAAVELAKGGIAPATIAAGALKDALALASAGELSLASAANITAKQLGVWADQGVTSADVANLMAQAANASTVGVEELALGLANVGGVAKVSGLSFRETLVAMAELAPGFSSAADAGTSFKAFLAGLTNTSKPAIEAMEMLGLRTEDGKNKFFDATGSFIGMKEATELLSQATADLSEEQKQMALKAIFGSDAIRAAAIFAEGGAKGFEDMARAMGTAGLASDQAAAKQQGYNANMEQFQGSMETLQIVIGTKLLPTITELVGVLTSAANALGDFLQAGDRLDGLHQKVLTGAASFAEYARKIDYINEQTPFWIGDTEKLTQAQFELAQALMKSGADAETAMQRATTSTSEYAFVLDQMISRTNDPAIASGLQEIDQKMLALIEHGGGWAKSLDEAFARFQDTGDIEALKTEVNALTESYTASQEALKVMADEAPANFAALGISADTSTVAMAGLTDAAQRYANMTPAVTAGTDEANASMAVAADTAEQMAAAMEKAASQGIAALASLSGGYSKFYHSTAQAQIQHERRIADIMKGGGGGGGGRAKAADDVNKQIEKADAEHKKKLEDLEERTQDRIVAINQQTDEKLAEFDQRAVERRQDAYQKLVDTVAESYADLLAQQEANDLELIGADEKNLARLQAREEAELAARQRTLAAQEEARQIAETSDAEHAQRVYDIREEYNAKQQKLDEEYAKKKIELADNPEALAALEQQYNEATAALKSAEDTQLGIAQAGADERKAKAEDARQKIVDEAAKQRDELMVKAEEERTKLLEQAEIKKNEIIAKAQEQATGTTGAAGKGNADQLAAAEQAYRDQLAAQGLAYAEQQLAQRAHLGQMLIDYLNAKAVSDPKIKANLAELTDAVAKEYGVRQSTSAATWATMTSDIDAWAASGEEDVGTLITKLSDAGNAEAEFQRKSDELAQKMTDEVVKSFQEGNMTIDAYIKKLLEVPGQVNTSLNITETRTVKVYHEEQTGGVPTTPVDGERALGGPVSANSTYLVGEQGPELFVPQSAGTIIPAAQPQMMSYVNNTTQSTANSYTYAPTYAAAPPPAEHDFALLMARAAI